MIRSKELAFALWEEISETATALFECPVEVTTPQGRMRGEADGEDITLLYVGRRCRFSGYRLAL